MFYFFLLQLFFLLQFYYSFVYYIVSFIWNVLENKACCEQ